MKRLTKKVDGVYITNCDNCPQQGDCYGATDCVDVLVDRLAQYEEAEEAGLAREEEEVDEKAAVSEKEPTFGVSTVKRREATYY